MAKKTNNDITKIAIIALLVLNILLGVYIAFIKPGAYALESLKIGWKDNMNMAKQLYKTDIHKNQVKASLEQSLDSINQASALMVNPAQMQEEDASVIEVENNSEIQ